MGKDEALRLALDALEYPGPSWIDARQPAITAIKTALKSKDEPVAWQWLGSAHFRKKIPKNADKTAWNPLYHYSPPQTWAGLTDEDISEIVRGTHNTGSFVRAIESKLKEKNT